MKFRGKKVEGLPIEYVPILRPDGDIVFIVKGIQDLSEFGKVCPQPMPPKVKLPGGKFSLDFNDKAYKLTNDRWWQLRSAWIFIKSIEETKDFEWETIDPKNPETYLNWMAEMATGFIGEEIARVIDAVTRVNSLNQSVIDAARETFLQGEEQLDDQLSSPKVEAPAT